MKRKLIGFLLVLSFVCSLGAQDKIHEHKDDYIAQITTSSKVHVTLKLANEAIKDCGLKLDWKQNIVEYKLKPGIDYPTCAPLRSRSVFFVRATKTGEINKLLLKDRGIELFQEECFDDKDE